MEKLFPLRKLFPRKWLFIILSFYLIIVVGLWILGNRHTYAEKKQLLEQYAANHKTELEQEIFNKAFSDSEKCQSITNEIDRLSCERGVSRNMGIAIQEEELIAKDGLWPHELFFVKEEENKFYLLGWSGKIEDRTTTVDVELLRSRVPLLVKHLLRKCNFFTIFGDDPYDCQTYASLPLSQNQTGYIIRITPQEEETLLWLDLMWPIGILTSISSLISGNLRF